MKKKCLSSIFKCLLLAAKLITGKVTAKPPESGYHSAVSVCKESEQAELDLGSSTNHSFGMKSDVNNTHFIHFYRGALASWSKIYQEHKEVMLVAH